MKTTNVRFPFATATSTTKKLVPFSTRFKKAIKARSLGQLVKLANDIAKDYFAPYIVMDMTGSAQLCWTYKDAKDWMRYMGDNAYICETYDYMVIESRAQHVK